MRNGNKCKWLSELMTVIQACLDGSTPLGGVISAKWKKLQGLLRLELISLKWTGDKIENPQLQLKK